MILDVLSPNHDDRRGQTISAVIVHDTEGVLQSSLRWLCDPASRVSAHRLIGRGGEHYRLVADEQRAWHAGISNLHTQTDGRASVNGFSLGVELEHLGEGAYPPEQLNVLVALLAAWCHTYNIPLNRVVGHRDVAPGRKVDPCDRFPWSDVLLATAAAMEAPR